MMPSSLFVQSCFFSNVPRSENEVGNDLRSKEDFWGIAGFTKDTDEKVFTLKSTDVSMQEVMTLRK